MHETLAPPARALRRWAARLMSPRGAALQVAGWMARANAAWYEAKYAGRGRVRLAAGVSMLPLVATA